jgi:hypothetical protein
MAGVLAAVAAAAATTTAVVSRICVPSWVTTGDIFCEYSGEHFVPAGSPHLSELWLPDL